MSKTLNILDMQQDHIVPIVIKNVRRHGGNTTTILQKSFVKNLPKQVLQSRASNG